MSHWENKSFSLCNMKFPEKLWLIVNDCDSGAIGWGPSGETIAIEYEKFQEEYLDNNVGVFKTKNMSSFVRQLNLYGFRKCNRYNLAQHEFRHPLFMKGRKELIQFVKRKSGSSVNLKYSIKTPRRSKVKTNTEFYQCEKENVLHDKLTNPEGSVLKKDASKNTPKKTPSRSLENLEMMSSMGEYWWNNISSPPYPTNYYFDQSIVEQAWFPMNSSYYNSRAFIKRELEESSQNEEGDLFKDAVANENQLANKNSGNMFYLVVPGCPSSQSHNLYANPGYFGGMFPHPGMPLGLSPHYSRDGDSYLGEIPVRFEAGNQDI